MKKEYLHIIIFILVASGLYFYYTPYPSFWIDESIVANLTHLSNGQLFNNLLTFQSHPPSFHLLIKSWRLLFGESEVSLRLPSLIFFLLTIVATYFFAKELFGEKVAKFSLLFSSTSHFLIFFSHQVRPYEMLAFISVASFYFFVRMIKKFSLKTALGYLFFSILGFYTNYWFVLAFLAQGLIIMVLWRNIEFKKIFLTMFFAGLSFLPWAILYLRAYSSAYVSEAISKSNLGMLWQSMAFLTWGQALPILSITAIVLIAAFLRKKRLVMAKPEAVILFFYLLIPIVSAYIISKFLPIYTPGRREILIVPALAVLFAYIFSQLNFKKWFLIASIILIAFASQPIADSNTMLSDYRSNDKKVLIDVFDRLKPGDSVILPGFSEPNFDYYWRLYSQERGEKEINKLYLPSEAKESIIDLETIKKLANDKNELTKLLNEIAVKIKERGSDNIYLFLSDPRMTDDMVRFFDSHYKMVGEILPELPQMPTYINGIRIYSR